MLAADPHDLPGLAAQQQTVLTATWGDDPLAALSDALFAVTLLVLHLADRLVAATEQRVASPADLATLLAGLAANLDDREHRGGG